MTKNSFVAEVTFKSSANFKESQICIPINIMLIKVYFFC